MFTVIILYLTWPKDNAETIYASIKTAFAGSTVLSVFLYVFFAFAWRAVWKFIPWLNSMVLPDLNGNWNMIIEWNRGEQSGEVSAIATIRLDFLRISMEVHSKDSDSETLLAQLKRSPETGLPLLFYVYRVHPKRTAGNDYPLYDGSAVLKLSSSTKLGLEGNYFTDAKTRGHFRLTRT
jgi:hypothetical protein